MIWLTRLSGKKFVMNCEWIKCLEATPDTIVTLTTGEKLMVSESVDEVIQKTIHYKQEIYHQLPAFLKAAQLPENEKEKI